MQDLHPEADERVSSAVHIVAFLLATLLLVYSAELVPEPTASASRVSVFATAMVLMYLVSALFHAVEQGRLKQALERLDRASIFVFIAASYSLFEVEQQGVATAAIWAAAIVGAGVSLFRSPAQAWATVLPYLVLGWVAVAGVAWQARSMSDVSLCLLLAGALSYTVGLRYYMARGEQRFAHARWHLFVAAGSAIHAAAGFA